MLYRFTELPLDQYPMLSWDWFVEQPIESDADETTKAGDDHPARLYLKFRSAKGETHAMEIIWGNRKLRAGDWKYLKSFWSGSPFPHYVARGGDENAGRWHDERVDLRTLYRKNWGDPRGATLQEVALFCDTDATGAQSVAYFSSVRVEPPKTQAQADAYCTAMADKRTSTISAYAAIFAGCMSSEGWPIK
jgi:hypothetical protein